MDERGFDMGIATRSVLRTRALTRPARDAMTAMCAHAFEQDFGNLFDFVSDSIHLLTYHEGMLIGHACWATRWLRPAGHAPLRTAYVDAVATDPAYRGRGVGSAVIRRLIREIQPYDLGGLSAWPGLVLHAARLGARARPDGDVRERRSGPYP